MGLYHPLKNIQRAAPHLGFDVDKAMASNPSEFVRCLQNCAPTINAGMAVPTIHEGDEGPDEPTEVPPTFALGGDGTYMRCSFITSARAGCVTALDSTTTVGMGPPPAGDPFPAGVEPTVALTTIPADPCL